jgi:hypothetical protein
MFHLTPSVLEAPSNKTENGRQQKPCVEKDGLRTRTAAAKRRKNVQTTAQAVGVERWK